MCVCAYAEFATLFGQPLIASSVPVFSVCASACERAHAMLRVGGGHASSSSERTGRASAREYGTSGTDIIGGVGAWDGLQGRRVRSGADLCARRMFMMVITKHTKFARPTQHPNGVSQAWQTRTAHAWYTHGTHAWHTRMAQTHGTRMVHAWHTHGTRTTPSVAHVCDPKDVCWKWGKISLCSHTRPADLFGSQILTAWDEFLQSNACEQSRGKGRLSDLTGQEKNPREKIDL